MPLQSSQPNILRWATCYSCFLTILQVHCLGGVVNITTVKLRSTSMDVLGHIERATSPNYSINFIHPTLRSLGNCSTDLNESFSCNIYHLQYDTPYSIQLYVNSTIDSIIESEVQNISGTTAPLLQLQSAKVTFNSVQITLNIRLNSSASSVGNFNVTIIDRATNLTISNTTVNEVNNETFGNLTAKNIYLLSVVMVLSDFLTSDTLEYRFAAVPTPANLTVNSSSRNATLTWEVPADTVSNSSLKFLVQWTGNNINRTHNQTVDVTGCFLDSLTPGDIYKVEVLSLADDLSSDVVSTTFVTKPETPKLNSSQVNATSIWLRFNPSDNIYNLIKTSINGLNVTCFNATNEYIVLSHLQPLSNYNVSAWYQTWNDTLSEVPWTGEFLTNASDQTTMTPHGVTTTTTVSNSIATSNEPISTSTVDVSTSNELTSSTSTTTVSSPETSSANVTSVTTASSHTTATSAPSTSTATVSTNSTMSTNTTSITAVSSQTTTSSSRTSSTPSTSPTSATETGPTATTTPNGPPELLPERAWIAGPVIGALVIFAIAGGIYYFRKRKHGSTPTGLYVPDMGPPPKDVAVKNFADHYKRMHADSGYYFALQWSELDKESKSNALEMSCETAGYESNKGKNRFTNILPYDHSRVKLDPYLEDECSDYINANFIPGRTSRREYIACQGPTEATINDHWRMIYEHKVSVVVMLTRVKEERGGRMIDKCASYWPEHEGDKCIYGDIEVKNCKVFNRRMQGIGSSPPHLVVRDLQATMGSDTRMVKQYHCLTWDDHGAMNATALTELVNTIRSTLTSENYPVVVHCSAGVGRTGTFMAVDMILQAIRASNSDKGTMNIYDIVVNMRKHRCTMVQTEVQYVLLHECVVEAFRRKEDGSIDSMYEISSADEETKMTSPV